MTIISDLVKGLHLIHEFPIYVYINILFTNGRWRSKVYYLTNTSCYFTFPPKKLYFLIKISNITLIHPLALNYIFFTQIRKCLQLLYAPKGLISEARRAISPYLLSFVHSGNGTEQPEANKTHFQAATNRNLFILMDLFSLLFW